MKNIFNILGSLILGFCPILLTLIFDLFIYNEFPNYMGISICVILLIGSFWWAYKVFKLTRKIGFIGVLSINSSSPDLDNLKPVDYLEKK